MYFVPSPKKIRRHKFKKPITNKILTNRERAKMTVAIGRTIARMIIIGTPKYINYKYIIYFYDIL